MSVDENEFFRQATIRICSSLNIETALRRCYDYLKNFLPVSGMDLHILDPDMNALRFITVKNWGRTKVECRQRSHEL